MFTTAGLFFFASSTKSGIAVFAKATPPARERTDVASAINLKNLSITTSTIW
jgi:hypothetical protein